MIESRRNPQKRSAVRLSGPRRLQPGPRFPQRSGHVQAQKQMLPEPHRHQMDVRAVRQEPAANKAGATLFRNIPSRNQPGVQFPHRANRHTQPDGIHTHAFFPVQYFRRKGRDDIGRIHRSRRAERDNLPAKVDVRARQRNRQQGPIQILGYYKAAVPAVSAGIQSGPEVLHPVVEQRGRR